MVRLSIFGALILALAFAAVAQTPPAGKGPATGCDTPQSHQLDFWVGKWEVHPKGSETIVAHSLVEKRYSGCAVRENWMPLGKEANGGGGSLSLYDSKLKRWRQTWIDSTGTRVDFDGGFADGVMSISGSWAGFGGAGQDALVRMHYQPQSDGQVRQWAEASSDGGKSWKPAFDLLYRHVDKFPAF